MKSKILMILQSQFPPDIRLEKEIKSLYSAGFTVKVVCNQYIKNYNKEYKYCSVDRVKALFNSQPLNKILNFPIFFNPRFLLRIFISIIEFKPDFIHSHDLPMAPIGVFFSKIFGIPLILDMHENYPAALKAFQKKGIINFLFKNYRAASVLEKFCIKHADRIITVVEENSDRIVQLGIQPEKIFKVSNTVDLATFAKEELDYEIVNKYRDQIILLYTGFVSPERGLETVVTGMRFLTNHIPLIKLLIVGNGISLPFLKQLAKSNNVEDVIEFIPWPGHENLGSYLHIANIGISPQPYNDHWNNSIPHKLFEYMSQSIPVLVTDAIPLKRIILETKAGLWYRTNDSHHFAKKVKELMQSDINYGQNGSNAVLNKYNWEIDSKELILLYKQLSEKKPK